MTDIDNIVIGPDDDDKEWEQQQVEHIKERIAELSDEAQVQLVRQLAEEWDTRSWQDKLMDEPDLPKDITYSGVMTGPAAVKEQTDTRKTYTEWLEQFSKDSKSVIEAMKPLQEHQNHMTFMNEILEMVNLAAHLKKEVQWQELEEISEKLQNYINHYGNTE